LLVVPASKPSGLGLPLSCRASSRTECGSLESGACEARSPKGQQPPAAVASEDAGREASQAGQGWQPLQVPRIRFRCTWRILLWQDCFCGASREIVFGARGETCSGRFRSRGAPYFGVFVIRGETCSSQKNVARRAPSTSRWCKEDGQRGRTARWDFAGNRVFGEVRRWLQCPVCILG